MIWRIWFLLMFVLVGGVWLFAIPYSPQPILATGTVIHLYRAMGMVPEAGGTSFSKEIDHDVFEVPERDQVELEMAMASMGMESMAGMDMNEEDDHAGAEMESMAGMDMNKDDDHTGTEMENMAGMDMNKDDDHAGAEMAGQVGMDMKADGHDEEQAEAGHGAEEEGGHGGGSEAEGLIVLVQGTAAEVDRIIEHNGITIDTTTVIDMQEWSVGSGMTMAQPGQIVRLTIKNSGNLPHEFMIMNGAAMEAVSYRLNLPDWNLLEHRATMEIPFLMPGDTTDVVVKITKSGIWMYMCMFPYHMQLGMMGMLMTPDMMGQMDMNMEMKLFLPGS